MSGWGITPWGAGGWGGAGGGGPLRLQRALAIRENVVRLYFDQAVRFTGLLDPKDASNRRRYDVQAIAGTVGIDGLPARPVFPAFVAVAPVELAGGSQIDLTVDRFFSPVGSRYRVSVNNLVTLGGIGLESGHTSSEFDGLQFGLPVMSMDTAVARRDIANPQTLAALQMAADGADPELLASFPVDETGDYAVDQGIISYKKRVFRRLTTRKGRFLHLLGYGVGIPSQIKELSRSSTRQLLAADAEEQIKLEPETLDAQVRIVRDENAVGLFRMRVRCRVSLRDQPVDMDLPVVGS